MRMTKQDINFMCFSAISYPDLLYTPYCPSKVQDKLYYIRRKKGKFFKQYCKKKKIKYLGNGKFLKI